MRKRILIVRNDKLGDFILSFPAIALMKKNCPDCHITVLVPDYTLPMAKMNRDIDDTIIDPGPQAPWRQQLRLFKNLRAQRFDAVITLFSTFRIGLLLRFCAIPYRLAPATKLAQIFYNQRLLQRRSRSLKPEHQYNSDLVEKFLREQCQQSSLLPVCAPYLTLPEPVNCKNLLNVAALDKPIVVIHPGSGGSANNLTLEQYAALADRLAQNASIHILISAGPGEEEQAKALKKLIKSQSAALFLSNRGLDVFAQFLSCIDLFIAGSTGTLHLAAALDVPTLGFYPSRRSATALRWQTINSDNKRLAISAQSGDQGQDMSTIDLDQVAESVFNTFPTLTGNRA